MADIKTKAVSKKKVVKRKKPKAPKKPRLKDIPPEDRPLSDKEIRFCDAYIERLNRKYAMEQAGYSFSSDASCRSAAHNLLKKPNIKKYIAQLKKEQHERLMLSADDVLAEISAIARFDMRNLFDSNGRLLSPDELDSDTARCVSSIKRTELYAGSGAEREQVGDTVEIKAFDKLAALRDLGKHYKLFADKLEVGATEELRDFLKKIDGKSVGPPSQRGE